ncbi:sugar ABC transporter permease [Oceanobacillus arenosus]|uniref:Autoinducer 2 import system permease protein LsrC n=1 Tax=Oceanobacillus arenosus TaxID=1229153 RepID=A0A3D8Q1P7_9BACI|nr:sugar ABC transporter permease [Oceanobacillus arenosus]RDW21329.1 sugar ABC transporter permease [Oceanobacillus arenosus]
MSIYKNLAKKREFRTLIFLAVIFIIVGFINTDFLTIGSIQNTLKSSLLFIVLVVGLTIVLLTGNIDISVGGTLGLSAAVCGLILKNGGSIFVSILAAIFIGAAIGLINGLGVTKLKISSFIMTLGMLEITRVIHVIYTNGQWVENLPAGFKQLSQMNVLGINVLLIIVLAGITAIHLFLTRSRKGRYFSAIGDNIDGAILLGVPVQRYVIYSFIASGVCAALAGLIFASQIGFISTNAGLGIEMTVIAAAVLGGVSLSGGVGTVIGATIGAVIMISINSALIYMKIPAFWNDAISGLLLIMIVVTDAVLSRRADKHIKKERLKARVLKEEVSVNHAHAK